MIIIEEGIFMKFNKQIFFSIKMILLCLLFSSNVFAQNNYCQKDSPCTIKLANESTKMLNLREVQWLECLNPPTTSGLKKSLSQGEVMELKIAANVNCAANPIKIEVQYIPSDLKGGSFKYCILDGTLNLTNDQRTTGYVLGSTQGSCQDGTNLIMKNNGENSFTVTDATTPAPAAPARQ